MALHHPRRFLLLSLLLGLGSSYVAPPRALHHTRSAAARAPHTCRKRPALAMKSSADPFASMKPVAASIAAMLVAGSSMLGVPAAWADRVGEIPASGFIFKVRASRVPTNTASL